MVAPILAFRDAPLGAYNLPQGGNALVIGDSISAENVGGQYAAALASIYGWTPLGQSDPIVNGTIETNATGWNAEVNCTLARASDCPGVSYITGAWALKVTATASSVAFWNCGGTAGALRLNMAVGSAQTFGCGVWMPVGTTGTCFVQIIYQIGSSGFVFATSNVISAANAWQNLAVVRSTLPVGTTEAYVRFDLSAPTAGQSIWVDGAYLSHTNGDVRPAIGGAALGTNAATGNTNSILDNWAARVTAYGTAGVYVLAAGTNDFFAQSATYTPASWGAAVRAALANLLALSPRPAIVVLGLPPAKTQVPSGGLVATGFATGQALRDAMDAQTRMACYEARVPFVPLWDMPLTGTDGIHPDASLLATGGTAHAFMAKRVRDVMNRVVR